MKHPNIIVFFTDQQRGDTLGANGSPLGLTPILDQLAGHGTNASSAITPQPVCGPARSCLQTGQYANQTGVWRNGIGLDRGARTLAHCFRDHGYATGYIGKWHLAGADSPGGHGPVPADRRGGYESWLAAEALELLSGPYSTTLWNENDEPVHLPGYRVDAMTDAAIRHLSSTREEDDRPQFLFLSYLEPHHQNTNDSYPAPRFGKNAFQGTPLPPDLQKLGGTSPQHWAGYCGMIKRLDEAYGRLVEAVDSLQFDRETIFCFFSDHGCHFKTRNAEYKRSCHESSVHVPLVFHGGPFDGGGTIRQPVSLVDVPPTLLEAAGIPVPDSMSGESLLPLVAGQREDPEAAAFVQFGEGIARVGRALRTKRWKYAISVPEDAPNEESPPRYVETHLYDLEADPYELDNLVESEAHASVREALRTRLSAKMKEVGEPACELDPATTRTFPQRTIDDPDARAAQV